MQERSVLYKLKAYLIYVNVGERNFLYGPKANFVYVKVEEKMYLKQELRYSLIIWDHDLDSEPPGVHLIYLNQNQDSKS